MLRPALRTIDWIDDGSSITLEAMQPQTPPAISLLPALAPICAIVFLEFLAIGLPLPVLPMHVHGALGFGSFVVGIAIGMQSWATLATRHAAGTRTDAQGPRRAAMLGLLISVAAGTIYSVSSTLSDSVVSLLVLLLGRVLLGVGESLVITAALAWGVALAGPQRSGLVMAWVGIAMYGAIAVGAPLGSALDAQAGFLGVSLVSALAPLAGIGALLLARPVTPLGGARLPFRRIAKQIGLPGAGLALAALGFGAIAAFGTLLFNERGWSHSALAMTAFGTAFVLSRLLFGALPDRFGGARIAAASAAVATVGQLAIWFASSGTMAVAASALTGLGFSLAFPAFGIEAIRGVPPQNRGVALGAYTACFDLALGVGVPLLGVVVGTFGYSAAFAVGALAATGSLVIAVALSRRA